jgi:hypothetical protein
MHFGLTALRGDFLESLVSAVVSGFAAAVLDVVPVAISTSKARPRILENYTLISAPKRRATHDGMCSLRPDSRRLWNQIRAAHGVRRLICANEPTLTPPSATGPAALARLLLKTAGSRPGIVAQPPFSMKEVCCYLQIAPRSRSEIQEYADMERQIDETTGRINGTYGEASWQQSSRFPIMSCSLAWIEHKRALKSRVGK